MTDSLSASVLRRKLAPRASPIPAAGRGDDGPARALVRCFARAVSNCAPLMAEGGVRGFQTLSLAELIDSVDSDAFVGLLSGQTGPPGLAIIDQKGFAALIEAMTIGRLAAREPAARRATATDAALLAEVMNAALARLDDGDPARGLTMDRPVPDLRLLPVLLDDVPYAAVTLDLMLVSGDVRRAARVALALPVVRADRNAAVMGASEQAETPALQDWTRSLEASVMTVPATLQAELGRITLPLAEVLGLGPGSALTLPLSNLEDVQLVALDGSVQAAGRLGQSRGMRAVRLTGWPGGAPDPGMFEQARAATGAGQAVPLPVSPPAHLANVPQGPADRATARSSAAVSGDASAGETSGGGGNP